MSICHTFTYTYSLYGVIKLQRCACLIREPNELNVDCLQIGTLNVCTCAKALNKPVYVMAESFKFVKEYPLSQRDIPLEFLVGGNHSNFKIKLISDL